jgi:hypothetical protein
LMVGVDYDRWAYENSPYLTFTPTGSDFAAPWRFTINVSKTVALPIPFARNAAPR